MNSIFQSFPFLAISLLLIFASIVIFIRIIRKKFSYFWLLSTFGVLITWILVLLSRAGMPYIQNLANTFTLAGIIGIPSLLIDGITWPFSMTLITLTLVLYLSFVVQASQMDWLSLMGGLVLSAFGILAIQARDATTILTSWAVIDIMEFLILFLRVKDRDRVDGLIKRFSIRVISIFLFIWGTSDVSFLVIAAAIRLIVIPASIFAENELDLPKSMVYFLSIISPASALIVFARIALSINSGQISSLLFGLLLVVGLFAGINWFRAADVFEGRRFWILANGSFAVMSAVRGLPIACISWGVAMLLSGAILFFDEKNVRKPVFAYIGLLAITSIPYMPTWDGASLYTTVPGLSMIVLILTQSLVVCSYYKHLNTRRSDLAPSERWVQIIIPGRMVIIIAVYWLIAFLLWRDGILLYNSPPRLMFKQIIDYFIGFVIAIICILILLVRRSRNRLAQSIKSIKIPQISFDWMKRIGNWIFQRIGAIVEGFSSLVEGESGILLTLLLLALLITFFIQGRQ